MDQIQEGLIGIPGTMTSAFLLLSIALGKLKYKEMLFSEIPNSVLEEEIDFGLVIHESQITFPDLNLIKIFDLGKWWNEKTGGLPVPLGINVASAKYLTMEQIIEFDNILKRSIEYSIEHLEDAVNFSMKYGRNTPKNTLTKFIQMYVNDFTIEMKSDGKKAISQLFELAKNNNILDKNIQMRYSY